MGPSNQYFEINNCVFRGRVTSFREIMFCFIFDVFNAGSMCGWACTNFKIKNCRNYGDINFSAGGICGSACQQFTITHCKNYGTILGDYAGGICGSAILTMNTSTTQNNLITNCVNYGDILGYGAGGICGAYTGFNNSSDTTVTTNVEHSSMVFCPLFL